MRKGIAPSAIRIRCILIEKARNYTVILEVEGPAGKTGRPKVWGVSVR